MTPVPVPVTPVPVPVTPCTSFVATLYQFCGDPLPATPHTYHLDSTLCPCATSDHELPATRLAGFLLPTDVLLLAVYKYIIGAPQCQLPTPLYSIITTTLPGYHHNARPLPWLPPQCRAITLVTTTMHAPIYLVHPIEHFFMNMLLSPEVKVHSIHTSVETFLILIESLPVSFHKLQSNVHTYKPLLFSHTFAGIAAVLWNSQKHPKLVNLYYNKDFRGVLQ